MSVFLDFLFPKYCVICDKSGRLVCKQCLSRLRLAEPKRSRGIDWLVVIFDYRQPEVRKLVKSIKYRFFKGLIEEIFEEVELDDELKKVDWIVPIPLHKERENWRGFNQAEEIGREVARRLNIEMVGVLERRRKTRPLVEMRGVVMREREIRGSFKAENKWKEDLRGKRILLVDDVFTSGATMKEAVKVLLDSGAGKVWGFALAG